LYIGRGRTTKTVHTDIMRLSFPDHFARGVILLHVIKHIPDLRAAFATLKRILKPYLWILLKVPKFDTSTNTIRDCLAALVEFKHSGFQT
jgi:ubiquinone/menaquinone biosynthesis C-methylase UbiE